MTPDETNGHLRSILQMINSDSAEDLDDILTHLPESVAAQRHVMAGLTVKTMQEVYKLRALVEQNSTRLSRHRAVQSITIGLLLWVGVDRFPSIGNSEALFVGLAGAALSYLIRIVIPSA